MTYTLPALTDSELAALQIIIQHSHNSNLFPQYQSEQYQLLAYISNQLNKPRD